MLSHTGVPRVLGLVWSWFCLVLQFVGRLFRFWSFFGGFTVVIGFLFWVCKARRFVSCIILGSGVSRALERAFCGNIL